MKLSRRTYSIVGALTCGLFALSPAAWSFFSSVGAGSASAGVATLAAPTGVSGSPSGDTVALTWAGPTAPDGGAVDGYYVQRSGAAAGGSCASSATSLLAPSTSCTDTAVPAGTYTYTVVAVYRSWTTASATSAPVTVVAAPAAVLDHFDVTAPAGATAGTAFNVTITAKNASGTTATTYAGNKTLTWSGPAAAPNGSTPTYPSSVAFTDGVGTASVTLVKAESTTVRTTEGSVTGTSASVAVAPAPAARFAVSVPSPLTAGTSVGVTTTARDRFENTATAYTGAKTLAWTGPGKAPSGTDPTYPSSVDFTNGISTAAVTLVKAETTNLTATLGSISGTSANVVVSPGSPARLAWTDVSVSNGTLSVPCRFTCTGTGIGNFGRFTARVSVTDAAGNVVTNLGSAPTVAVSTPSSGAGSGGAFTSPTAGTTVTLTISATGAATSTATFTFEAQNGNWQPDTFAATTASGTSYPSATATVSK